MKYCPQCGKPNRDAAKFCEGCGIDISNIQGAPIAAAAEPKPMSEETKKTLRYAAVAVILIILAGCAVTAWKYFTRVPTALDISGKYMDDLKANDYADAYQLINPNLKLDKEVYIYAMKKTDEQLGKVKDYRIDSNDNNIQNFMPTSQSSTYSTYENIPVMIGRNQPQSTDLVLINIGTSDKADWRIDLSGQVRQASLSLPKVPKLEVKACGQSVNIDSSGNASITCFNNISVPVEISGPNIVSKTINFPDDGYGVTLEVSDKLQKELETVINGFNQADIKAKQDGNMEHYAPYLVRDCGKWQQLQENCDYLKESTDRPSYSLRSVEYDKGHFESNGDKSTVELEDTELWNEQSEYGNNDNTVHWTYVLQLQDDGAWKVSDNY